MTKLNRYELISKCVAGLWYVSEESLVECAKKILKLDIKYVEKDDVWYYDVKE